MGCFSRIFRSIFLALVLINFMSCNSKDGVVSQNDGLKIVSLSPSNTEILVGLSLSQNIIAVDKYSEDVRGIGSDVEVFQSNVPNIEALVEMNPDVIFLSDYDPSISFDKLEGFGIEIVNISTASNLDEIYESILIIGSKTGKEDEARDMVEKLKLKVKDIRSNVSDGTVDIYFEISQAPHIYSFGSDTFINEIIQISGGKNIFGNLKGWISPNNESIIEKNPQIIFTNVNIEGNIDEIKNRVGWQNIDAVKNGNIYYIDKNSSSRPSQFFVESLNRIHQYIEEFKNE